MVKVFEKESAQQRNRRRGEFLYAYDALYSCFQGASLSLVIAREHGLRLSLCFYGKDGGARKSDEALVLLRALLPEYDAVVNRIDLQSTDDVLFIVSVEA